MRNSPPSIQTISSSGTAPGCVVTPRLSQIADASSRASERAVLAEPGRDGCGIQSELVEVVAVRAAPAAAVARQPSQHALLRGRGDRPTGGRVQPAHHAEGVADEVAVSHVVK